MTDNLPWLDGTLQDATIQDGGKRKLATGAENTQSKRSKVRTRINRATRNICPFRGILGTTRAGRQGPDRSGDVQSKSLVQVAGNQHDPHGPEESSSNNLEKDDSPGQENRPKTYNVMPAALPTVPGKKDPSKLSAGQMADLLRSCKQELQQARLEIQRQTPLASLQDLAARASVRTVLNKSEVTLPI